MHINVYRVHWHSFEVCTYIVWFVTVAYTHMHMYTIIEMGICNV